MFAEVVFDWAWDEQIRSRRIGLRSPNEAISVTLLFRLLWSVQGYFDGTQTCRSFRS